MEDNDNPFKLKEFIKKNALYLILSLTVISASATALYLSGKEDTPVIINNEATVVSTDTSTEISTSVTSITEVTAQTSEKKKSATTKKTTTTKKLTTKETTSPKTSKTSTEPTAKAVMAEIQTTTSAEETTTVSTVQFPIEINSVTVDELVQINGIGEVTAEKIINYRESVGIITDMDMLLDINGIGDSTLAKLKNYLYVADEYYCKITEQTTSETTISYTDTTSHSTTTATKKTTTSKRTTTSKVTTTAKSTTTVTTTEEELSEPQSVNVNTADEEEIAECLLIDEKVAESIVEIREQIGGYTNILELLYA